MLGAYKYLESKKPKLRLLASGVTLRFALEASETLEKMGINCDVWSITSFNELYKDAIDSERLKLEEERSIPYVEKCFSKNLVTIAVSEYQRSFANQIRQWVNGEYVVLGTDGFGRSDTREKLRDFFEISSDYIVLNALKSLGKEDLLVKYLKENDIKLKSEAPWQS